MPKKYTEDVSKPLFAIRSWKTPYEMKKIARDVRVPYNKLIKNIFLLNNKFLWPGMYKRGCLEQPASETSWERKKASEIMSSLHDVILTVSSPHKVTRYLSYPHWTPPFPPSPPPPIQQGGGLALLPILSFQNKFISEPNKKVTNINPNPTWSRTAKKTIGAEVKNTL